MAIRKVKFYTFLSIFIMTMFLIPSFLTNAMLGGVNSWTKIGNSYTLKIDVDGSIVSGSHTIFEAVLQPDYILTTSNYYYYIAVPEKIPSSSFVVGFKPDNAIVISPNSAYSSDVPMYIYGDSSSATITLIPDVSPSPEPSPEVSPSPEPSPEVSPSPSPVPDVPDVPSYVPNTYLLIIIFLLGVIAVCNLFRK